MSLRFFFFFLVLLFLLLVYLVFICYLTESSLFGHRCLFFFFTVFPLSSSLSYSRCFFPSSLLYIITLIFSLSLSPFCEQNKCTYTYIYIYICMYVYMYVYNIIFLLRGLLCISFFFPFFLTRFQLFFFSCVSFSRLLPLSLLTYIYIYYVYLYLYIPFFFLFTCQILFSLVPPLFFLCF